jgi:hypothetical protein
MDATQKTARIAGVLYLLVTITGLFSLMYVPGQLFVRGNATATISNIASHQTLYELYIVVGLISEFLFLTLVLFLYRLLKDVSPLHAALMLGLVLLAAPLAFVGESYHVAMLALARGADFLGVFDKPQHDAIEMLILKIDDAGTTVAEIFWGLWLLPLAYLVFKSRLLPRLLGVWLAINGVAYVILSGTSVLLPHYQRTVFALSQPALFGEMALMLWLLIMGARRKPTATATAEIR